LLRRLETRDEKALGKLWGSICHQGSVYSASRAAVPHLVRIAGVPDPDWAANLLVLAGSIHAGIESADVAALDADLAAWYGASIPKALALALSTLDSPLKKPLSIHLLQAAAAFAGYTMSGRMLEGFIDREFTPECPECGSEVYVWPDGNGLKATVGDPVHDKNAIFVPVRPGIAAASRLKAEHGWLKEQCKRRSLRHLAPRIESLFGTVTCPECEAGFPLADHLERD